MSSRSDDAVRVLVVTNDRVAAKRAGPAIRSYETARVLGRRFAVTLTAAIPIEEIPPGVTGVSWENDRARLRALADGSDVLVLAPFVLGEYPELLDTDAALVADLTDPYIFEQLALTARAADAGDVAGALRALRFELEASDLVLCASERQRMLYLGMLGALGRLTAEWYAHDATLERLVAIVPFGSSDEPFDPDACAGPLPGPLEGRRVLLWGGGVWNWLDPLTPIKAAARLMHTHPDATLVFMGRGHPHPALPEVHFQNARAAERYAEEHLLAGRSVVFGAEWVPFDERRRFLARAEIGVSAHPDSAETRFAFRTRLLDYFWAGLPVVTTAGDVLADLVAARGAGRVVPCGNDAAMAAAFAALLDDPAYRRRCSEASRAIAAELCWEVVTRPLAEFIARVGRGEALLTGAHGARRGLQSSGTTPRDTDPAPRRRAWLPWSRTR
jgi:glycosyltransferase involved in cell wall biosynthesis